MEIPQDIQEKWELLRDHGDVVKIAKETGLSKVTVSKAFNNGKCSQELYEKISDFYERRENACFAKNNGTNG